VATVGHAFSSKVAVPAGAILAGFGLVPAVTMMPAGHERSLVTILGGLLGGQFVLHSLYAAATGWSPPSRGRFRTFDDVGSRPRGRHFGMVAEARRAGRLDTGPAYRGYGGSLDSGAFGFYRGT
jgi:hypothetical protein